MSLDDILAARDRAFKKAGVPEHEVARLLGHGDLLSEAVEVGTLCNLAAEETLNVGMTSIADALSRAALTISKLAAALQANNQVERQP